MALQIIECLSKSDFKAFVNFQFDLYKGNEFWVPPIKSEEVKALMPDHNPAFEFCEAKFWLAKDNNKVVGRIGAIINHAYNEKVNDLLGRFTRFEFVDNKAVSKRLIDKAEQWLKGKGMTKVHGPLGFTNLDHQGMLIDGYDYLPSVGSEYHLPYYKEHIRNFGYQKEIDWLEFRLFIKAVPDKAQRVAEIVKHRNGFNVIHFTSQDEMKKYSTRIFDLLNDAFADLFSVVKLSDKMIQYYTKRYMSLLNPSFVKVIEGPEKEIVAFIIGLPSLSSALQKAKGRIFPFGWYYVMKALKKPKVADLLLTGVDPAKQGTGVAALLINELQQVMLVHGVEAVETTGILETNEKAISNWKNYDHIQHKRKRCWQKELV